MKKLFIHVRTALVKAGTSGVQFWLFKMLLRNRFSGIDRMDINGSKLAFVSSTSIIQNINDEWIFPESGDVVYVK